MPDTHITSLGQRACAYELGCRAARYAAAWITDGNDTDESRAAKLELIENSLGLPVEYPNLSGEWAGDPTPRTLCQDIMGFDSDLSDDQLVRAEDELAQAWEDGVSDTFETACTAELRKWIN